MRQPISEDEKKWRAESDARCIAEAEAIKKDSARMAAAANAAKGMAEEQMDMAKTMAKVASWPLDYSENKM